MQRQNDDCKVYRAMLFDYVSDLLSDKEKTDLLSHIETCPNCSEELAKIESIIGAAASLPEVEVPNGLKESVAKQISNMAKGPKHRNIYTLRRFASVALPLAACAVLTIGIYSNGLLDSFIKSDDILSPSVSTEESDAFQTPTYNDGTQTAETDTSVATQSEDKGSAHINSGTTSKNKTKKPSNDTGHKEAQNDNAVEVSEPSQSDITTAAASSGEDTVATNLPAPAAESPITEETDKIAAYNSREAMSYPISCTITTFDLSAFAARFGGDTTDDVISIEIPADNIDAIMNFAAEYGIEITFDYSPEYSDTITVTVQTK